MFDVEDAKVCFRVVFTLFFSVDGGGEAEIRCAFFITGRLFENLKKNQWSGLKKISCESISKNVEHWLSSSSLCRRRNLRRL